MNSRQTQVMDDEPQPRSSIESRSASNPLSIIQSILLAEAKTGLTPSLVLQTVEDVAYD